MAMSESAEAQALVAHEGQAQVVGEEVEAPEIGNEPHGFVSLS